MDNYLIPANTKKSLLWFGMLRPFPDAVIFGIGLMTTIILLLIIGSNDTLMTTVSFLPMAICLILVLPIPYYHNLLVCLQSILRYSNSRKNYLWKGWCVYDEFKTK